MPAAIFPIVVTRVHHGDMPTALQVVLGTSIIGLITIPLWIGFGLQDSSCPLRARRLLLLPAVEIDRGDEVHGALQHGITELRRFAAVPLCQLHGLNLWIKIRYQ